FRTAAASATPVGEGARAPRRLKSRYRQQLRFAPGFFPFFSFGADLFYEVRFDRIGSVTPFAADVGEDRGDLVVVKNAERRHVELKRFAFYVEGAVQAVQNDARQSPGRTEHPFRINERRGKPFLALAVWLMARAATDDIKLFALVEPLLLLRRQRFHHGLRLDSRFSGPGEEIADSFRALPQ